MGASYIWFVKMQDGTISTSFIDLICVPNEGCIVIFQGKPVQGEWMYEYDEKDGGKFQITFDGRNRGHMKTHIFTQVRDTATYMLTGGTHFHKKQDTVLLIQR